MNLDRLSRCTESPERIPDARRRQADEADTRRDLPYTPLPFWLEVGAQIGPKRVVPSIRKLLAGANFSYHTGKTGSPKNKVPSRHHDLQSTENY
jgi:hypothetical protein